MPAELMSVVAAVPGAAERERWHLRRRANEQRLFAHLADGNPAARDAIVAQFMPLARQLARRYRNVEDIEDLEQVAAIGLVKAIDRFDPERGLAFSSFAFPTIVGELKRHLRDRGWSVRPPREIQELAVRLDGEANVLHTELGRSPTVAEVAERVERSVEKVLEAMQAATARRADSLDQPRGDIQDGGSRGLEIGIDEPGFADAENAVLLDSLMRALSERERQVVNLRFREDLTQSQIGEAVGISQMHVSRLLRAALEKLRVAALPASPSGRS